MSTISAQTFSPEFDTVYGIRADGTIFRPERQPYVPDVMHDDEHDVLINWIDRYSGRDTSGWDVLTGHTGQHGYNGAVMHPSELWSACHVEDLTARADAPGVGYIEFAVVEVRDEDGSYPDGDPIGWAVICRKAPPTLKWTCECGASGLMPEDPLTTLHDCKSRGIFDEVSTLTVEAVAA